MVSIEYSLFRTKFIKSLQVSLFPSNLTPEQLFLTALQEKPAAHLRKGHRWQIGNIRLFSENTGVFAIGRTTISTIEKFDQTSKDFREEELETSPYTHCVFDARIGLLGIAAKSNLAPTVKGIAAKIQLLLSKTSVITSSNVRVEVAAIPDPDGFLEALKSAYRVPRFAATFSGPNPFDADELFQRPLSVYLSSAHGTKGRAQIEGTDLDREVLGSVTRSTAATGNEASASIIRNISEKAVTMHLKGDPVRRRYDHTVRPQAILLSSPKKK